MGISFTESISTSIKNKLNQIVKQAQDDLIQKELGKIEAERVEIIQEGNKQVRRFNSRLKEEGLTIYGDPENDPPVAFEDERIYRLKNIFQEEQLTYSERIEKEVQDYLQQYQLIIQEQDRLKRAELLKEYWNELTSEIEDSATKGLKWTHLGRQQGAQSYRGEPPYYAKEYEEYIGSGEQEMEEYFNNYHIARGGDLGPDTRVKGRLETGVKERLEMTELIKNLKDEETGLYWYAGMLIPVDLSEDPNLSLGANQGSRFFNSEGMYRSHDGMDFSSLPGTTVKSTINGRVTANQGGRVEIQTFDKQYKVVYYHMPPSSSKELKIDSEVTTGTSIGEVGGWGCRSGKGCSNTVYPYHLHYEVWESQKIQDLKEQVKVNEQINESETIFVPVDPRTVDLSEYQRKK